MQKGFIILPHFHHNNNLFYCKEEYYLWLNIVSQDKKFTKDHPVHAFLCALPWLAGSK
jgi:hypothetical protein